jgi:protease I
MNRLWHIVSIALVAASVAQTLHSQNQQISSFSIVIAVCPNDFTDREYFETRKILQESGARITVASIAKGLATSHDGKQIRIDASINELMPNQFEAIVLIGGMGAIKELLGSEALRNLLIAAYHQKKIVAAICVAPIILAKAGLLRNKQATCYSANRVINEMKRDGAIYKDSEVLEAERIITANGPDASDAFARKIIEALKDNAAK